MNSRGDVLETFRAVIDGVKPSHNGQQCLRCTYIRRSFIAADVLFSGLQCHAYRVLTSRINGYADDTTRNISFIGFFGGEVGCMRTSEAHWDSQALSRTNNDVGAPFSWRR